MVSWFVQPVRGLYYRVRKLDAEVAWVGEELLRLG
jgi:hypothetical protein